MFLLNARLMEIDFILSILISNVPEALKASCLLPPRNFKVLAKSFERQTAEAPVSNMKLKGPWPFIFTGTKR